MIDAHRSLPHVMRAGSRWQDLRLYHKSEVLYQLTVVFCRRFLPLYGDRTVDQMIQAARSGKQNIVEGSENGKTSTEMELKLLNVARSSIAELREDFKDHLMAHRLEQWTSAHPRYAHCQMFTQRHNDWKEYSELVNACSEEELSNLGLTLCFQMDAMLNRYLKWLDQHFVQEGGVKERMHKARTGYRQQQDAAFKQLQQENAELKQQLEQEKARFADLRSRALKAYYEQKEKIEQLEAQLALLQGQGEGGL